MVIDHREGILSPVLDGGKETGDQIGQLIQRFWIIVELSSILNKEVDGCTLSDDAQLHSAGAILLAPPIYQPLTCFAAHSTTICVCLA